VFADVHHEGCRLTIKNEHISFETHSEFVPTLVPPYNYIMQEDNILQTILNWYTQFSTDVNIDQYDLVATTNTDYSGYITLRGSKPIYITAFETLTKDMSFRKGELLTPSDHPRSSSTTAQKKV